MSEQARPQRRRRTRKRGDAAAPPARAVDYRSIENTLPLAEVFSADQVAAIHQAALRVLEELGIRVLLDDARARLAAAGAKVDDATQMVYFDRGLVERSLGLAPTVFTMHAPARERNLVIGGRNVMFGPGAGCPNVTDLDRGRRPGRTSDFVETIKLLQCFDIMSKQAPCVEPQDLPIATRHLDVMRLQLTLSDKVPFIFARGTGQVEDSFELMRIAAGLTHEAFVREPRTFTVINTNSPRQLDVPMAQGIIDFARYGQGLIVTPFCLSGAMAPITIAGALTLSHAEALAGITLAQVVKAGTPVVYGAFSSNVDMKSGAPAFGTPEHIKTNIGAGQLARHVGLPWRSGAGSAASNPDVQAAHESQLAVWGCMLGGAHLIYHAAGWLEGGLTFSMEKFITDLEMLQVIAESMLSVGAEPDDIGFDAIAEVQPGGHFFSTTQTMQRYSSAFYEPLVADWSNYGQWVESGQRTATDRANSIWKKALQEFEPPAVDEARIDALDAFIERRKAEGGAPPVE